MRQVTSSSAAEMAGAAITPVVRQFVCSVEIQSSVADIFISRASRDLFTRHRESEGVENEIYFLSPDRALSNVMLHPPPQFVWRFGCAVPD